MLNDQRTSPRKILKTRAVVACDGLAPLVVRTVDVGANGVCLTSPTQIQPAAPAK